MPDTSVLETVTFRLFPAADPGAFLAAAHDTAPALRRQPGFVARRLVLGGDGLWTDHVEWADGAAAQAAAQAVMADPAFAPFMALIDPATVDMRHAPILWRMD